MSDLVFVKITKPAALNALKTDIASSTSKESGYA
jgi:hypothetical protein